MNLLFFDLFFDFCVAPVLEQNSSQNPLEAATAAALSACTHTISGIQQAPQSLPFSSTLSRLRIALFKFQLFHTFINSAELPIHIQNQLGLFVQCAQSLGLAFL